MYLIQCSDVIFKRAADVDIAGTVHPEIAGCGQLAHDLIHEFTLQEWNT